MLPAVGGYPIWGRPWLFTVCVKQSVNGQGAERSGAVSCGGGLKRQRRRPEQPGWRQPPVFIVRRSRAEAGRAGKRAQPPRGKLA